MFQYIWIFRLCGSLGFDLVALVFEEIGIWIETKKVSGFPGLKIVHGVVNGNFDFQRLFI